MRGVIGAPRVDPTRFTIARHVLLRSWASTGRVLVSVQLIEVGTDHINPKSERGTVRSFPTC